MKKNYKTKAFCRLSMKCSILFCSILLLGIMPAFMSSSVYGQQAAKRISLKLDQVSVLDALREVNRLGDNSVVFKKEQVERETRKVKVDLRNVTLLEAVEACIENTDLSCVEYEGKVVVVPKKKPVSIRVTGIIKDDMGQPLPGATIVVKGDSVHIGTSSNVNGEYTLTLPLNVTTLVYSFVGYKTQEIILNGRTKIDVILSEDTKKMDEVIVTGVFTRKAESYTGAAKTITADELKRVGNQNLFQSLKNLDPSLQIMDNLTMGSDPNSLPDMKLRGTSTFQDASGNTSLKGNYQNKPNQPLFILDGFEASVEKIFDMDMNRIASVTILKDAAAKALYGSKAANGVVVIETKRLGVEQARVTYVGSLDVEMPDLTSYDLCNAAEKLEVERIEGIYDSNDPARVVRLKQIYNERRKSILEGLDTYWLAKPLRTGIGQKHTISIEMGEKSLKAFADFSYNNIQGVMKGSTREVIAGSIDLSYRHKTLLFRNQMSVTNNKSQDSPYGTFDEYAQMNPYFRAVDENGKILRYAGKDLDIWESNVANPLYNSTLNTKLTSSYLEFTNNFYVDWTIIPALKATVRIGITAKRNDADTYYPSEHSKFAGYGEEDFYRRGSYQLNNGKSSDLSGDFNVNYNKSIGKHNLFGNVGMKLSENKYNEVYHLAEGFPSERMDNIMFARQYAKDSRPSGVSGLSREISFLGSFGYDYDNRYLFEATIREGASSMFGNDNRWATFWSLGIGWNLHHEKFMQNFSAIEQLKLKGSIGSTGNQNFRNNRSLSVYNYYLDKSYQGFIGSYLGNMENPALKWEQKMDYNVGLEMAIKGLKLDFNYYVATTKNLVTTVSIPMSTGFSSVSENLGKVRNRGIELNLGYTFWQNKDGFLAANFAITTNDNKIIKISDALRIYNETQNQLAADQGNNKPVLKYVDGMPMDAIWAVPSLGIDPANGQEIYVDKNGNTTYNWNASDMIMAGTSDSKYRGNFGFNGEYKGFGLSVVFTYLGGGKMYNQTLVNKVENIDFFYNVDRRVLSGRWQTPGQHAYFKKLGTYSKNIINDEGERTSESVQEMTRATTRFVQKRNELTFSSLSVYYDLKREWISQIGLQRLQLAFYMNDIEKFSTIKVERGTSYPFARTMSFKLSGTF